MLKPRYFYSRSYSLVNVNYLADEQGFLIDTKGESSFKKNFSRITVCGIWNTETNVMTFGIAKCSTKDVFVKKIGRDLAYERALNNPIKSVDINDGDSVTEIFLSVAQEFENEHNKKIFGII